MFGAAEEGPRRSREGTRESTRTGRRDESHGSAAQHAAERHAHEVRRKVRRIWPGFGESCVAQHRQRRERREMRERDREDRIADLCEREYQDDDDQHQHRRHRSPTLSRCQEPCVVENAAMKVARYRASGTTHNKGADTTSVAMCWVTPSSNADGTRRAGSRTSGSRCWVLGSGFRFGGSGFWGSAFGLGADEPVPTPYTRTRRSARRRTRTPPTRRSRDAPRGQRFHQQISQQPEQAACVARGVQKVRDL